MEQAELLPILKWAGGKRWLTSKHESLFPSNFENYIEPFLGGGAVFCKISPNNGIVSDLNPDLINVYLSIKEDWKKLLFLLKKHEQKHSIEYYYQIRSKKPKDSFDRAAWFIYLNKTCWNGLYRVNLKGEFNVPIGTKEKVILPSDNYEGMANLLSNIKVLCKDFESVIDLAQDGDFVFVDPPYTVKHNLNGFVKYNENLFSWNDQIRLRDCVIRAVKRGTQVLVLNADHSSIREIYHDIGDFKAISRASVISSKPEYRGKYTELAIKCGY
jgi:DNA adenine methylase